MTVLGVAATPAGARPATTHSELGATSRQIAHEVAEPNAGDVDRRARFPSETLEACSESGLLGALVPVPLGGMGATLSEVGDSVWAIGRHCASASMILAMHHLQVACLVRHGRTTTLQGYVGQVAELQLLLASATTEVSIGGQLRASSCAIEPVEANSGAAPHAERFRLEKQAPVISYGAFADAVLVTARRHPDSSPNDQVLALCPASDLSLKATGDWDTLGMRGTCSNGFLLHAESPLDHVLPEPFGDIAEQTMLPVSHILWGYVWLGVAASAAAKARRYVQSASRKDPGTSPPGAVRLAELMVEYRRMEATVRDAAARYDRRPPDGSRSIATALSYNSLKVAASTAVVDIVTRAMAICGINGYREDSPYSLGRQLRDAHGSVVMVNNDRILSDNAHLLLVDREEL